jgi:hypothetical protein
MQSQLIGNYYDPAMGEVKVIFVPTSIWLSIPT